jgi:hypothetical protein
MPLPLPTVMIGVTTHSMKKELEPMRKHGYKARAQEISRRLRLSYETNVCETPQNRVRLTTQVTFEKSRQSYLWVTDRGRSRLIKH